MYNNPERWQFPFPFSRRYAQGCGFHAVMVTVDSPVLSMREHTYGNPEWVAALSSVPGGGFPGIRAFEEMEHSPKQSKCARLTWSEVAWMVGCTTLKVPRPQSSAYQPLSFDTHPNPHPYMLALALIFLRNSTPPAHKHTHHTTARAIR